MEYVVDTYNEDIMCFEAENEDRAKQIVAYFFIDKYGDYVSVAFTEDNEYKVYDPTVPDQILGHSLDIGVLCESVCYE